MGMAFIPPEQSPPLEIVIPAAASQRLPDYRVEGRRVEFRAPSSNAGVIQVIGGFRAVNAAGAGRIQLDAGGQPYECYVPSGTLGEFTVFGAAADRLIVNVGSRGGGGGFPVSSGGGAPGGGGDAGGGPGGGPGGGGGFAPGTQ